MLYIYTMEYYSAIKNNEFKKFLGKCMEQGNIILSEVTQSQKTYTVCIRPKALNTQDKTQNT